MDHAALPDVTWSGWIPRSDCSGDSRVWTATPKREKADASACLDFPVGLEFQDDSVATCSSLSSHALYSSDDHAAVVCWDERIDFLCFLDVNQHHLDLQDEIQDDVRRDISLLPRS